MEFTEKFGRPEKQSVLDVAAVLQRFDGDRELLAEVVAMFPAESEGLLERMHHARALGETETLRLQAHTLKGLCLTFEAKRAASAAFALESVAHNGGLGSEEEMTELRVALQIARDEIALLPSALENEGNIGIAESPQENQSTTLQ